MKKTHRTQNTTHTIRPTQKHVRNVDDDLWIAVVAAQEARAIMAVVVRFEGVSHVGRVFRVQHAQLAGVDVRVERVPFGVFHVVVVVVVMAVVMAAVALVLVVAVLHRRSAWYLFAFASFENASHNGSESGARSDLNRSDQASEKLQTEMKCVCVAHEDGDASVSLFGECAAPSDTEFVAVDGGESFSIGIDVHGAVIGWGSAFYGELGSFEAAPAANDADAESEGSTEQRRSSRTLVLPARIAVPEKCVGVTCGTNHALVVSQSGG